MKGQIILMLALYFISLSLIAIMFNAGEYVKLLTGLLLLSFAIALNVRLIIMNKRSGKSILLSILLCFIPLDSSE